MGTKGPRNYEEGVTGSCPFQNLGGDFTFRKGHLYHPEEKEKSREENNISDQIGQL